VTSDDYDFEARYLSGSELYGDDIRDNELTEWYAREKERYAGLGAGQRSKYRYLYHALNVYHLYRHLPRTKFDGVLSIGGAWGNELLPLQGSLTRVTIVEPSTAFHDVGVLKGVDIQYASPAISGGMPWDNGTFDLRIGLSVLHHIANVIHVISEIGRCTKPGGYALIREPTISMGDWRCRRADIGLTPNERGIPVALLRRFATDAGFSIVHESWCYFAGICQLGVLLRLPVYNSPIAVFLDHLAIRCLAWNQVYHTTNPLRKTLRAAVVAMVLRKTK
jgi:SAM-dependent methyltransferase